MPQDISQKMLSPQASQKCLIQVAYAIGVSKPLSILVKLDNNDEEKVKSNEYYPR